MSPTNEAVVQRWWQDLWNRGDLSVADQIIAPSWTDHDPSSPWAPPGIDGCKVLVSAYRAVFPDIHFTIEKQVASATAVVSHWRCRGTHRGDVMGIAPTGKMIEVEGITILELAEGKIHRGTTIYDALGMMQQIGAVPAFGQATA
jgi:steroid delta-isomerase-like uncharacterized protein